MELVFDIDLTKVAAESNETNNQKVIYVNMNSRCGYVPPG
jgi:subtilase family serine protease